MEFPRPPINVLDYNFTHPPQPSATTTQPTHGPPLPGNCNHEILVGYPDGEFESFEDFAMPMRRLELRCNQPSIVANEAQIDAQMMPSLQLLLALVTVLTSASAAFLSSICNAQFATQLLSCVSAEATSNRPHRPTFVRRQRLSTSTGSLFNTIPRGGADGDSSSAAPDMSSLLSGMDIPGMPDMSQPPSPEQIQQSMEQFSSVLSSPQFKEMLNDPSKMEASLETMRTSLLSALEEMEKGDNPMMAMMLEQMKGQLAGSFPGGWDGLVELVNDPAKWKEMMGGLMDVM